MTATLPQMITHPNGNGGLADPALWARLELARELHIESEEKITLAESCRVCPDWEDAVCDSCQALIGESLELIDRAGQLMNGGVL